MTSEIRVDKIHNEGGDNDSGLDMSTNDVVAVKIAGAEKVRVHSDGKVGIANNAPDQLLTLGTATGYDNPRIQFYSDDTNTIHFGDASSAYAGYIVYDHTGEFMAFAQDATERMRINGNYGHFLHKSHGASHTSTTGQYNQFNSATNGVNTQFKTTHGTFTSRLLSMEGSKAAGTDWDMMRCFSNDGSDLEFQFRSDGNAYADGSWSGSGADYAEFFETTDGKAITIGTTVVLDGGKIRASTDSDAQTSILGVIRPKGTMHKASMTIGNTAWNQWTDTYLTDDFEQYIMEEYTVTEWWEKNSEGEDIYVSYQTDKIPSDVKPPSNAVVISVAPDGDKKGEKLKRKKRNPDYDASKTYVNREGRDEWQVVGLLGQVRITKGQRMGDRWIKMRDISSTVEEWMIK